MNGHRKHLCGKDSEMEAAAQINFHYVTATSCVGLGDVAFPSGGSPGTVLPVFQVGVVIVVALVWGMGSPLVSSASSAAHNQPEVTTQPNADPCPTLYLSQVLSGPWGVHTGLLVMPEGALVAYASCGAGEPSSIHADEASEGDVEGEEIPKAASTLIHPLTRASSQLHGLAGTRERRDPIVAGLSAEVWAEPRGGSSTRGGGGGSLTREGDSADGGVEEMEDGVDGLAMVES
ncbi:hypothetical protein BJ138DRAFT_1184178 [Hygrophoropsis aurantiaca]|uniref:Uncharacterized protein n=1 Tax=Hygrophoropsis aurantiaca TaxID=72124 RepID=A0ACB7ZTM3_9AGAM|nr:hypothetical protein BJ138DRAFT_1184178 [Hygrophoropsis aurantiaca]